MFLGISAGFAAAILMSVSYILSKMFMLKHSSALHLTIYSQLTQGCLGIIVLAIFYRYCEFPLFGDGVIYWKHIGMVVWTACIGIFGNFSFFRALKELEASRLSSMIGLKILLIGAICALFRGETFCWMQWTAVILGTIAAAGMNFSGGPLSLKAVFWLFMTLIGYSLGDLAAYDLQMMVGGENRLYASFVGTSCQAIMTGILMVPLLFLKSTPVSLKVWRDAMPYGACWFTSLLFLFFCFGQISVVFGTIIQSSRGIFSVIFAMILVHFGFKHLEPRVGRGIWIQRLIMACLMVAAMALYALSGE